MTATPSDAERIRALEQRVAAAEAAAQAATEELARVLEEHQAAQDELQRQGLYDDLTGLPNRTLLMERLHASLGFAGRSLSAVDVLYVGIDDFKTINDSQGRVAGDELLAAVAERLVDVIRHPAPPGPSRLDTVARLAGDEFALVLDDCPDPARIADRIQQRLKEGLRLSTGEVFVTVSMGIARAANGSSADDLLAAANVAMHEAKRTGKARHLAFEPQMQEEARRRHALGEELHRAIINEEFVLAYQPVIDLTSEAIIGAEALVRWQHPGGELMGPDAFIHRAEETGLIVALGAWVLGEACRQGAIWRKSLSPEFSIAVNVSGRQLHEVGFDDLVRMLLRESGLPAEALCLEMTESILMEREEVAISMLTELRAEGVHLAIDDFGTGYSSLSALRKLPIDLIKIDQSFVASLPEDDDAGTIAWAVVSLGHSMGIPVLAEGVETNEQRDALVRFGCDQAQGYLYARPLPPQDFEALL